MGKTMLDELFMQTLDMTKTASAVILVVVAARFLLKRAPKVISYALWTVVLLRLLCPWNIEAPVSIVPDTPSVSEDYSLADAPISIAGAGVAAYQAVGDALNGGLGIQKIPTAQTDAEGNIAYVAADWWDVWILFGQYVWAAGVAVMAFYSVLTYLKLRKSLAVTVPLRDNIYIADDIRSPFVIGLIRPKIYLPSGLNEKEQAYIVLHEQHHIRRMDHIWKALAFLALAIHWFNPLVWVAFILASRDMEMSCDEAVIRKLGEEVRADYSASLLTLATGRRIIAGTPLAFGEGDPKSRIRNLVKWKKPVLWITAVAVMLCAVLAVCLLTDPAADDGDTANVGITWYYGTVADRGIRVVQEGDRESRSYLGLTCNDGTEMMFWAGEGYLVPLGVTAGDHVMLRGSVDTETGLQIVHQVQEAERSLYDSLDDAINGAILEHNQNEKYERMFACASFVTLAYEGGGPASEMSDGETAIYHTFYGIALHQVYSEEKGRLKEESGSHIPTVLSFFRTDDGKYVLTQYWQPRDGTYYPEDIRAKFPDDVDPDTQKHIEAQQEECLAQAMEHFGIDNIQPTEEPISPPPAETVPPETEPQVTGPGSDVDFRMVVASRLFPLVYDKNDEWLVEYLGQFDYVDVKNLRQGAFYVLDKSDREIRLIFEEGVDTICETPNTVFCVIDGKKLVRTDYFGEKIETVYEAVNGKITRASRLDHFLCMIEGGKIVCLNLITYEVEDIYEPYTVVDRIHPYSYAQILWADDYFNWHLWDRTNGMVVEVTEVELNNLISTTILSNPTKFVTDEYPTVTVKLKCAAITQGGKTVTFVIDRQMLEAIREMFASAEKVSAEQVHADIILGPVFTLTGVDDYITSGQLALNAGLIKIGDLWYDYSPETNEEDGLSDVAHMLQLFGLSDWPRWMYDCYAEQGIEIPTPN